MARQTNRRLLEEISELKSRLDEASETLDAIRSGKVDAIVVEGGGSSQIYTLRSADHAYRMLVQQMHEGALTLSPSGTILYANERFSAMTGAPLDSIIGRELTEFIPERCRADIAALLGNLPSRTEAFAIGPVCDIPVSFAASAVTTGDSHTIALIVTDLTEQKARDEAMQSERMARYASEEANRAKDAFLITVSHELRTPLTSILGWVTLLNRSDVDDETRRLGMTSIEHSTRIQAGLIDDLLDVSRIMTGTIRITTEPVDIGEAIKAALATARPAAEKKNVRLGMTCAPDLPRVRGDAMRLQQVFWILLANALKFTPQGGRIDVEASTEGGQDRIDVRDTGCGISPDFVPRLFDRFSQEDPSTTRQYGGMGLGLSLAHDLVQFHGGSISAASAGVSHGATFTVLLPGLSAQASMESVVVAGDVGRPTLDGLSVLAVDDDADTRAWLAHTLELFGARVSVVSSVAEAMMVIDSHPPDIVISDLAMPVDDGLSFVARLRICEEGRKVRAIALTAFGRADDRERLIAAGYDEYLRKPIDASQLVRAVFDVRRHSDRDA